MNSLKLIWIVRFLRLNLGVAELPENNAPLNGGHR